MSRFDIVDGEVIMSAGPTRPHQIISGNVYRPVYRFASEGGLGEVLYAPVDVVVRQEPLRMRQPDLLFVANENSSILGDRIQRRPRPGGGDSFSQQHPGRHRKQAGRLRRDWRPGVLAGCARRANNRGITTGKRGMEAAFDSRRWGECGGPWCCGVWSCPYWRFFKALSKVGHPPVFNNKENRAMAGLLGGKVSLVTEGGAGDWADARRAGENQARGGRIMVTEAATTATTRLTYEEYLKEPESMLRYEIVDGEMIMSAAPQRRITRELLKRAFSGPLTDS